METAWQLDVRRKGSNRSWRQTLSTLVAVALSGVPILASPAIAQVRGAPVEVSTDPACAVVAGPAGEGSGQRLLARCWGIGLVRGTADRSQSFSNPERWATIVEIERLGERRVLLLRPGPDGRILQEDITANVAVAAGRRPWAGLEAVSVDYGSFSASGRLVVSASGLDDAADAAADPGVDASRSVDLRIDEHIRNDDLRMATTAE